MSADDFAHKNGDLVLVRWKDERIYFAKIRSISRSRRVCSIVFEDEEQVCVPFADVFSGKNFLSEDMRPGLIAEISWRIAQSACSAFLRKVKSGKCQSTECERSALDVKQARSGAQSMHFDTLITRKPSLVCSLQTNSASCLLSTEQRSSAQDASRLRGARRT